MTLAQATDPVEVPDSVLQQFTPRTAHPSETVGIGKKLAGNGPIQSAVTVGTPGVDSLANWSDQFTEPGFDSNGNPQSVWPYTMVGAPPESGRTTLFEAPVVPVTLDLLDKSGNVAVTKSGKPLTFTPTPDIVRAVVQSPVFQPFTYLSGRGQFNDQMMRTQFWNRIHTREDEGEDEDSVNRWHNILDPDVKTMRHIQIPFGFWVPVVDKNGNPVAALVDFGTFANLLFPPTFPVDNTTPIGAAELAGDITTRDISTFLFNNVFLISGTDVSTCCVIGFHTYDLEPGDSSNGNRDRRFVLNYSSFIRSGFFSGGFEDVTAFSHEVSETFDDPFVNNATPWWLSLDPFHKGVGLCQNNLETGDVIEVLSANPVFPISMHGRTYHPQNEAIFPWFAFESPSPALHGAYSFPDETTLTSLSPGNLLPGCVPAP
jgi:hypothetical protein